MFNDAVHFFGMLFSKIHKWSKPDAKYERGALVRAYGVSVHAWNDDFLRLCVMGSGRFIRSNECTVDKARLDFERILISKNLIEIVNTTVDCVIDGCKYGIKLVEECGCCLGEDSFMTDEVIEPRSETLSQHQDVEGLEEVQGEWELDELVDDFHKEWCEHDGKKVTLKTTVVSPLKMSIVWKITRKF